MTLLQIDCFNSFTLHILPVQPHMIDLKKKERVANYLLDETSIQFFYIGTV